MPQERERSSIARAITALARHLARALPSRAPGELQPPARLSLAFVLPGIDDEAPFRGMRLCAHDASTGTLAIEAAVPIHVLDSAQAAPYALAVAADAVDAADEFFAEGGVAFDAKGLHAVLAAISAAELARPESAHAVPDPPVD